MAKNLKVTISATHAGFVNNNNTWYLEDSMRDSVDSWNNPFNKPCLIHHDIKSDPIGRVISAKYISTKDSKGKNKPKGHIQLEAIITDTDAIAKIKDGRYSTVSISLDATEAKCSICGQSIAKDGLCSHKRGKYYDGKKCFWYLGGEFKYKEVSYVNAPADEYAQNESFEEIENAIGVSDSVQAVNAGSDSINNTNEGESMEITLKDALACDEVKKYIDSEIDKATLPLKDQLSGLSIITEKAGKFENEVKAKDSEISSQKEVIKRLEDSVTELKMTVHKNLVDNVFNLRKQLQKKDIMSLKDATEIEAYKAELSKRSDESLSDAVTDLSKEEIKVITEKVIISKADGEESNTEIIKEQDSKPVASKSRKEVVASIIFKD